ncbi:tetratricopeptide repeat (TPR)-like superfamily protein [Actinidia rufa]|uniref:Tetratricopeptide repeat (TPR)-like superfamily protein n=1 Tax=Actinidia rufa TaxID=165716 RepID=A0A7J0GT52_9ERIC|nr:tetratricopeptide repeat (TPR)-like superfamily protein [Actinidia rufa]
MIVGLVLPNAFTFATVVKACSILADLRTGKKVHAQVEVFGFGYDLVVCSSLIDMYGKSNHVGEAHRVFDLIPQRNIVSWTSMITAYVQNGRGQDALELFREFNYLTLDRPNHFMLASVINACASFRLVTGKITHGAVIRNGGVIVGTLLSTSRLHGRVDIAFEASKWLIESNQQVAAAYVILSNTYALAGMGECSQYMRSEMKRNGVTKEPGCSWVEIKDCTYIFYAGDVSSCPRGSEVVSLLKELEVRMKERGYVGGSTGLVFVDVEEETKVEMVGLHSERLALGFGLISIPKGVTIRVMKNLRMCRDCHEAFKVISDIVEREILLLEM